MIARTTHALLAGCILLLGCTGSSRTSDTPRPPGGESTSNGTESDGSDAMGKGNKPSMDEQLTFTRGPDIGAKRDLVAWLDSHRVEVGKARRIRLPVWLKMGVMGIDGARIGAADGPETVTLTLSDAALGISLYDRANKACPNQDVCAMWLEGVWKGDGRFDVTKVHRKIEAGEAATYVEVEP